ncbi:hypothetical protein [Streptomyces sp. NPDC019539]|uniref:hypothetical protein n=1 Tax=Streptomyces sp. NPDC019539 TaxID=3365063 RepID=UPI0037AF5C8B
MTPRSELTRSLLSVLDGIPGLRPASPAASPGGAGVPWNLDALAVGIDDDLVEIRVVALALPLPPLLRAAEAALSTALEGTRWNDARLRLVVTDVDDGALAAVTRVTAAARRP